MEFGIPLTIQSERPKRSNDLRKPEFEDWQRWKLRIMTRYKIPSARVFVDEMEAEGLGITSTPQEVYYSTVAVVHGDAVCCNGDQHFDGVIRQNASNANVNLQSPLYIPNQTRLLHQALKSLHDWQLQLKELGGRREAAMSSSVWLRTHLGAMGWAVHCLENQPSRDQPTLAFKRLREASIIIHDNLEAKCSPPAVLMSMTAILKFGSPDNRPSSIYSDTAKKFFLRMAAEILSASHPTLLLLRLLLCEQSPEALPAICRAGANVIGQCIGMNSEHIWTSQIDLSHAATLSEANPEPGTCFNNSGAEISTVIGEDAAATHGLTYVYRLHSLSTVRAQNRDDLRKAYGAYQLLCVSQSWLNDSVGEEVSLQNALQLARLMQLDADRRSGQLSFELLQAIRDLYCYFEDRGNAERCRDLRFEYPGFFQLWDGS